MKKLLLIIICLPFLFSSCIRNAQEIHNTTSNNNLSNNTIIGFNITSKNSELTKKTGSEISVNEMITKSISSGEFIFFKDYQFTLNNPIDGALNFHSNNSKLQCNIPVELSLMKMPPDGIGAVSYKKGEIVELPVMSMIKIESTNFVISNIRYNK